MEEWPTTRPECSRQQQEVGRIGEDYGRFGKLFRPRLGCASIRLPHPVVSKNPICLRPSRSQGQLRRSSRVSCAQAPDLRSFPIPPDFRGSAESSAGTRTPITRQERLSPWRGTPQNHGRSSRRGWGQSWRFRQSAASIIATDVARPQISVRTPSSPRSEHPRLVAASILQPALRWPRMGCSRSRSGGPDRDDPAERGVIPMAHQEANCVESSEWSLREARTL